MKNFFLCLAVLFVGCHLTSGYVFAEAEATSAEESESTVVAHQAALAFELAELGRNQQSPELLVSAALILHRSGATAGTEKPTEGELSAEISTSPAAVLEEAKQFRKDDKALAEIIARAADELKEKPRGVVGGPKSYALKSLSRTHSVTIPLKVQAKKTLSLNVGVQSIPTQPRPKPGTVISKPEPETRTFFVIEVLAGGKTIAKSLPMQKSVNCVPPGTDVTVRVMTSSTTPVNATLVTN